MRPPSYEPFQAGQEGIEVDRPDCFPLLTGRNIATLSDEGHPGDLQFRALTQVNASDVDSCLVGMISELGRPIPIETNQ